MPETSSAAEETSSRDDACCVALVASDELDPSRSAAVAVISSDALFSESETRRSRRVTRSARYNTSAFRAVHAISITLVVYVLQVRIADPRSIASLLQCICRSVNSAAIFDIAPPSCTPNPESYWTASATLPCRQRAATCSCSRA